MGKIELGSFTAISIIQNFCHSRQKIIAYGTTRVQLDSDQIICVSASNLRTHLPIFSSAALIS